MEDWDILPWALFLFIAILIPPQKNLGANGFMKDWDRYIERPAKRLSPPKLIQVRYGIGNAPINIITYLSFLADFVCWLISIALLPCLLILKNKSLHIAILVYVILFVAINLTIGIIRTICVHKIAKKQKIKVNTEEYVTARSLAEALKGFSKHREVIRECKEYKEIVAPFLREFERCVYKKKGVRYISEDNLKWTIDRVIPKYRKHLSYSISNEALKNKLLTIRLIRNNQIILQIPIKKFN